MKLKKLVLQGFRSFSPDVPTSVIFDNNTTVFIGLNGSGKTAVLTALARLFGVNGKGRGIIPQDFFHSGNDLKNQEKQLFIEVWFNFPEITKEVETVSVPEQLSSMCFSEDDKGLVLRIRLEASLSSDGIIDEEIYSVHVSDESPDDSEKRKLKNIFRNRIQVHYIAANRDFSKEIGFSSKSLIGRFLQSIEWEDKIKDEINQAAVSTGDKISNNSGVVTIDESIKKAWSNLHKGNFFTSPKLQFISSDIDELLKQVNIILVPGEGEIEAPISRLSDGQRSLFYIALVQAVFNLEQKINSDLGKGFRNEMIKPPVFSMFAIEEPENHLAPHYLGRIMASLQKLGSHPTAQIAITSHSPSVIYRLKTENLENQIRYMRLLPERISIVKSLKMPNKDDERYKFVSEAIHAYPEIFFARYVVLCEGDSEVKIMPRLLSAQDCDIDDSFISVAPLGGRHVNYFWKLLSDLGIPFITLLDLDLDRNGGGWGRIQYAAQQLINTNAEDNDISQTEVDELPSWNDKKSPIDELDDFEIVCPWLQWLESKNVFYSWPLDIDLMMLEAFTEAYTTLYDGERGPQESEPDVIIDSVLKSGNKGAVHYSDAQVELFKWYRYRFLGKSKPISHIRALSSLTDEGIKNGLPSSLNSLIKTIIKSIEQLPE